MKLPKLNPNYEKAEHIQNIILSYVKDLLHLAFISDEKVIEKISKYYEICFVLKK